MPPDATPATRKLFVGLFVPAAAARKLQAAVYGVLAGAGLRVVAPEEVHLTLRFIGRTPASKIEGLRASLGRFLAGLSAPQLRIARTGSFPETGVARVLWVGVEEEPGTEGRLLTLARATDAAVVESGVGGPPEDPFLPHLTVARPARQRGCLPSEEFRRLRLAVPWHPSEVRLVESRPGETGDSRFPVIESFPLL
ncbi:MAG: RNA 2',3'-cyclic phosphodiesterase [Planctomycetota bacterium]